MRTWLITFAVAVLGCAPAPMTRPEMRSAVYIFVGVDCPISNGYAPELNRIIAEYSKDGIDFSLVYPDPAVTADEAAKHAKSYGYTCPTILDGDHKLARRFGISVTPEAAVVSSEGKLQYLGRIDDLYVSLGHKRFAATTHELKDALDAIANNRPVQVSKTTAVGCSVD